MFHNEITIVLGIILNFYTCEIIRADYIEQGNVELSTSTVEIQDSTYEEPEEKWLENALKDIAYYLRNHKFNEWDRRYYTKKTQANSFGFYKSFPIPNLKTIHWEVHKNCHEDFYKCITYLHSIIETAPFTRSDDILTSLNKNLANVTLTSLESQNKECQKASLYSEKTGLPFSGPKEKFRWRTSASYYMCWYTMKGVPALSMLGESCDNFANCLDSTFGIRNHDPRADDKLSFACAMYSFCPDPCCPLKYVRILSECHYSKVNPCYIESTHSSKPLQRRCSFDRKYNLDLDKMIENKWNVSCYNCPQKGFKWDSQFSMCVDINECTTKQHTCDLRRQDCLNLPGTYQCVCKWGYSYDSITMMCIPTNFPDSNQQEDTDKPLNVFKIFFRLFGNIF